MGLGFEIRCTKTKEKRIVIVDTTSKEINEKDVVYLNESIEEDL